MSSIQHMLRLVILSRLLFLANAAPAVCSSGIYAILKPLGQDQQVQSYCAAKYPVVPATSTVYVSSTITATGTVTSTVTSTATSITVATDTSFATVTQVTTESITRTETSTLSSTNVITATNTNTVVSTQTEYPPNAKRRRAVTSATTTALAVSTSTVPNTISRATPPTKPTPSSSTTTKTAITTSMPVISTTKTSVTTTTQASSTTKAATTTTTKANPLSSILSQASSVVQAFCTCIQNPRTTTVTSSSIITASTLVTATVTTTVGTTSISRTAITQTQTSVSTITTTIISTVTQTTVVPVTQTVQETVTSVTVTTATTCPTGRTYCSGNCLDLTTNKQNCGGCGKACTGDDSCVNGVCTGVNLCNHAVQYCAGKYDNTCVCFSTIGGGGICSKNGSHAYGSCSSSLECPNGSACSIFGNCLDVGDVNTCPNPPPSRLFMRRERRSGVAERDGLGGKQILRDGKIYIE